MLKKDKRFLQSIIRERIVILLSYAFDVYDTNPSLAQRYTKLIKRLCERYNVRLGDMRRCFCQRCFTPWVDGKTVRITVKKEVVGKKGGRVRKEPVIYECKVCGYRRVFPKSTKKKDKGKGIDRAG